MNLNVCFKVESWKWKIDSWGRVVGEVESEKLRIWEPEKIGLKFRELLEIGALFLSTDNGQQTTDLVHICRKWRS